VEPAEEADEAWPTGHVARELDRALDRFRAGLADEAHPRLADRRDLRQSLGKSREVLVPVVARDVQELSGGLLHRLDDRGVRVAGGADCDAGSEVEEAVAVDVPDLGAAAMRHHERIVARVRRRNDLDVAFEDGASLGAWQFGPDVLVAHDALLRKFRDSV